MRKILVTSALPYANGDIHIGHLVEYIQTDIYVRFLKLTGNDVIYMCASDAHGTPIEINASKLGITPQQLVSEFHERHRNDFALYEVNFSEFYTTDSPENRRHCEEIYTKAKEKDHIATRDIEQYYCESCRRFLPDRYIKGVCPKCSAEDQYGDVCESCGATYRPTELTQATCAICGNTPILKTSKHFFFKLVDFTDFLREWTSAPGHLQEEVRAFVSTWIEHGLQDWDISRDGPYFGFKIPGEEDKYFYVWLDAPIGYIAATEHYCRNLQDRSADDYWVHLDSDVEIHHFIGKDIAYFHTLFWPAMLKSADYRIPTAVHVHGFLTVNGLKMSKSRGTFITARKFSEFVNPGYLRYYYATKLSPSIDDLDLSLDEFVNRTNAELVNNITNLISRTIGFLNKRLESKLGIIPPQTQALIKEIDDLITKTHDEYSKLRFGAATRHILAISDIANNYVQQHEPWSTIKTDPDKARNDLTFVTNCIKIIAVLLKPILPSYSERVEKMLGLADLSWGDAKFDLEQIEIRDFEKLAERIEPGTLERLIEAGKETLESSKPKMINQAPEFKEEITIEDFTRVDLRAGRIISAAVVEKSDKLLELTIDLGRETRTIFAGIKQAFKPEDIVGKTVVVVANLKPRKMRFGVSEGMVLAASNMEGGLSLCELNPSPEPGTIIK